MNKMKNLLRKFFNWLVRPPEFQEGQFRFSGSTLLRAIRESDNPMMRSIATSINQAEKDNDFTALELVSFEFWINFRQNGGGKNAREKSIT